jgi:4-hydroxy-tetrahydrodipicolinate synthase
MVSDSWPWRERIEEQAFVRLVESLVAAGVSSIDALGSTGSYAYLFRIERQRVAQLAVEIAGDIPDMVSKASLLLQVSYQKLTDDVYSLCEAVSSNISVPLRARQSRYGSL